MRASRRAKPRRLSLMVKHLIVDQGIQVQLPEAVPFIQVEIQ
jgi:hypothetical protein